MNRLSVALAGLLLAGQVGAADGFPELDEQARSLRAVPGAPEAAAVVLFKRAEFRMKDLEAQEPSSRLTVTMRVKVLKPEGLSWGELAVPHSDEVRLLGVKGRTVRPDGSVVPLPADARFKRTLSQRERRFVTSVVFAGVEVGSILDLSYELRFDSIYFLEPWFLSERVPVLHSEIVYRVPPSIQAEPWGANPMRVDLKSEPFQDRQGPGLRIWAKDLPAVPEEPSAVPFADLATQFMLIPKEYATAFARLPMLDSWVSVCKLFVDAHYQPWRKKAAGRAEPLARELLARTPADSGARARTLFEYVRDRVVTDEREGVGLGEGSSAARVLERGRADSAEKALLLRSLLDAAGLPARLVWAHDRGRGLISLAVPNPAWFERMLVTLDVAGQSLYLDPSERGLSFGALLPGFEGSEALVVDPKAPQTIRLPMSAAEASQRRATLDLTVDEQGGLSGSGELVLSGHHFVRVFDATRSADDTRKFWQTWLEQRLPDERIDDLAVAESVEARQIRLVFKLKRRDEAVLGDELGLVPSRPLGPGRQVFAIPATQRRTPVLIEFGDREDLELRLSWPAAWRLEAQPKAVRHDSPAGAFNAELKLDASARQAVYTRRWDVRGREFKTGQGYEQLRALFEAMVQSDAQSLALVRR